ncbi:unnamed protein product [Amoebophrya sp. A25]|nr:unnamed protein product [Amoebophrya sp. A25]|eukprot:GSA25T00003153001.1
MLSCSELLINMKRFALHCSSSLRPAFRRHYGSCKPPGRPFSTSAPAPSYLSRGRAPFLFGQTTSGSSSSSSSTRENTTRTRFRRFTAASTRTTPLIFIGVLLGGATTITFWELYIRRTHLNRCSAVRARFDAMRVAGVEFYGRDDGFTTDQALHETLQPGDVLFYRRNLRALAWYEAFGEWWHRRTQVFENDEQNNTTTSNTTTRAAVVVRHTHTRDDNTKKSSSSSSPASLKNVDIKDELFVEGVLYNDFLARPDVGDVVLRSLQEHPRKGTEMSDDDTRDVDVLVHDIRQKLTLNNVNTGNLDRNLVTANLDEAGGAHDDSVVRVSLAPKNGFVTEAENLQENARYEILIPTRMLGPVIIVR